MTRGDIESGEVAPNWVSKMKDELKKFRKARSTKSQRWQRESIYMVPRSMKRKRREVYEPQTVSIGPYHYDEEHLMRMRESKQRALLTFLDRSEKPLDCYVEALAPVVDDLRDAYHDLDRKWKREAEGFLQLMILDGCFILELMRATTAEPEANERMGYARNDPLFSEHGKLCFVPRLKRDMLMLENQIPLQVLLILLETENHITRDGWTKQKQLSMLILKFFYDKPPDGVDVPKEIEEYGKCVHILELCRRRMLHCREPGPGERSSSDCLPCTGQTKKDRSATELGQAGIRFERDETSCLNDVSFEGRALKLPGIKVDGAFESKYLNMVAFEHLNVDAGTEVTSFVYFMDSIIHGARDVKLLRDHNIIEKALASDRANSDEGVAELFNSMSRDIVLNERDRVATEMGKAAEYCARPLPRFTVYSNRRYEQITSWVSLSILGGISFLLLTGVPAFYTILDYYHSQK